MQGDARPQRFLSRWLQLIRIGKPRRLIKQQNEISDRAADGRSAHTTGGSGSRPAVEMKTPIPAGQDRRAVPEFQFPE
jgi:hypothetical protein